VNDARNGIALDDTTGSTSGNLIVANADATNTADKLQLALDAAVSTRNSGSLRRRVISETTRLATLNGGAGVAKGTFTLQDTEGHNATVNLAVGGIETIGDVIDEINRQNLGIHARVNDAGDGILLVDTLGGGSTLRVTEGNSTAAADLHLLAGEKTVTLGGTPTRVIDGTTTYTVALEAGETLSSLITKINGLNAGVTASLFNDGSTVNPLRLSLLSQRAGAAGQVLIDGSQSIFTFTETARGQDALLLFGASETGGVLAASSSNTFRDILPGVTLTALAPSTSPVTVTVSTTDTSLVAGVKAAVDNYNKLRTKLLQYTAFDAEQNKAAELFGDPTALRLDVEVSALLSGQFLGAGPIRSLATLGITLKDDGTLDFDSERLKAKFAEDPAAVREFFTKQNTGFSARFKVAIESLANEESSLLANRLAVLEQRVESNNERVTFLNARLEKSRERLLAQFVRMELAIAQLQSNQTSLNSLAQLAASLRASTSR
jgi:flagellar hook-associated protein 2